MHMSLDLTVDFKRRVLSGFVELKMITILEGVDHFYLDIKGLNVKSVELLFLLGSVEMWTEIEFKIEEPNPDIG